ncbi:CoA transferase [Roseomonas stagni]|uniref:CoA transferase n=1 Tax=Falsiroseomonas algicola TaxID=2716930 RepID=A0A6M1LEP7_9PROT|nr:CaiB/BaiF CoA-transferase family protein [Falsiroseomonas algicola]NGM18681.1 CoA transferase [Falsiroseomonas algicola]
MADLSGLLVVAVEQAVAAPWCSCRLADAGARVIKIERREGDFARGYDRHVQGQSTYFVWLNRGKESLALDLKAPGDRDLLARIVARADVFIQNLAPGALGRLGLDSATLRARHPRLITCDISGYGESGPFSDLKAYDLLVQAESGLCSVTGDASGPARVGVSVCDIAAGMNAHAAILQALYARERTGEGRAIKVSLFSGMAEWMNVPFLQRRYGGEIPPRPGLAHPSIAPYGVFRVRDGQVLISIQNEREWSRFCAEVMGDAALATDPLFRDGPARVRNRADLDGRIAACFAQMTLAEAASRLKGAEVAFGRLNDVDGLIAHPQLRKVSYDTPEGIVEVIAPAMEIVGEQVALRPVPVVDAHGAAIRAEFQAGESVA